MQVGSVTTPFGRRRMTLGMLTSQCKARDIVPDQVVDKWKIFRALCEAKPLLGISDRGLAVMNALLSFYPGNMLSAEHGLVLFPSNAQLSLRAHGIAPATLRRHLAALVEAGLLVRRDSPNGKRFARRGGDGEIDQAFGFSIAPLIARAAEIDALAAKVLADRKMFRTVKERLSLCRRDIVKLIETAMEEEIAGDWMRIHARFRNLILQIPRSPTLEVLEPVVGQMEVLRSEVLNVLEDHINAGITNASESQVERHIQDSKSELPLESEAAPDAEQRQASFHDEEQPCKVISIGESRVAFAPHRKNEQGRLHRLTPMESRVLKSFPLGLVLQACPEIVSYGPSGSIGSWRDLMNAAIVVRSMFGVGAGVYEEACGVMGAENAATVMACMLERAETINSAGGYLRDLTRRAARGEFAVGPMLMSLARTSGCERGKAG